MPIQKITPFLWFDHQAEEAAGFYTSIFPNSKIAKVVRYGKAGPGPAGSVMTVEFQTRRAVVGRPQRRAVLQIHGGDLVCRELPDAGRSRFLLGKARRRGQRLPMRLAQGQVRPVVANRADPCCRNCCTMPIRKNRNAS